MIEQILIFEARGYLENSPLSKMSLFSPCTVGIIYTPIFSFLRKRVVNIAILELGPVSNESPGNFTLYRGIQEF